MKKVNLKNLYFYINKDTLVEVNDDVYDFLEKARKKEAAYRARVRYHKAFYSLDRDDGIETDMLMKVKSPEELFRMKQAQKELLDALNQLPIKQRERIMMFFFFDMSVKEIAQLEHVSVSSISECMLSGLQNLKKLMYDPE